MERLTRERMSGIKEGYWSDAKRQELVDRLGMYESTGFIVPNYKGEPKLTKRPWDGREYFAQRKFTKAILIDRLAIWEDLVDEGFTMEMFKSEAFRFEPYDHCDECPLRETKCKVYDRYQRLPRDKYRGALGMCMLIGGPGC